MGHIHKMIRDKLVSSIVVLTGATIAQSEEFRVNTFNGRAFFSYGGGVSVALEQQTSTDWTWREMVNDQTVENCLKLDNNTCGLEGGLPSEVWVYDIPINTNAYWQDIPLQDGNTIQCNHAFLDKAPIHKASIQKPSGNVVFEFFPNEDKVVENFMTMAIVDKNGMILACGTVLEELEDRNQHYTTIRHYEQDYKITVSYRGSDSTKPDSTNKKQYQMYAKNIAVNVAGKGVKFPIEYATQFRINAFADKECSGQKLTSEGWTGSLVDENSWALQRIKYSGQQNDIPVSLLIELPDSEYSYCVNAFSLSEEESAVHRIQPQFGRINGTYNDTLPDVYTMQMYLSQVSPFHPTLVDVSYQQYLSPRVDTYLDNYHVHEFPLGETQQSVSPAFTAAHHNPYGALTPFGPSIRDFETGDLSSKHGGVKSSVNFAVKYLDFELPLYGIYTIGGRSLVFHEVGTGDRILGANLTLAEPYQEIHRQQFGGDNKVWATIRQASGEPANDNIYLTVRCQNAKNEEPVEYNSYLYEGPCESLNDESEMLMNHGAVKFGVDMSSSQSTSLEVEISDIIAEGGCFVIGDIAKTDMGFVPSNSQAMRPVIVSLLLTVFAVFIF